MWGGGGNAIAQKIYVRNIEDTLLTVTLDGVPQGGNIFHHQGRILINPDMLKQVEIDKGGTVASVGPGGLAGSVRMKTKDARDLLRADQAFGGMIEAGLASFDGERLGGAVYGRVGDVLDLMAYGNHTESDDYEDGRGKEQKNSGSEQTSGLFKANVYVSPHHSFYAGYQTLEDEGTRFLRPHLVGYTGSQVSVPQSLEQSTLTTGYRFQGDGWIEAADIGFFVDDTKNRRTNTSVVFGKPIGYRYGEKLDTEGVNLKFKSSLAGHAVRYGLNYQDKASSAINPSKKGLAGNTSREDSQVVGVYAESSFPLGNTWLLDAGARYDWYDYEDNHRQHFSSSGLSPNAAITYFATDALSVRLGGSRIVRGAGLKEAFMLDNGPGPFIYRNVRNLKEETADNWELSANYQTNAWNLHAAIFHLQIDDYIALVFDGAAAIPASRKNVGTVKSAGYEIGAQWQQDQLKAGLSLAFSQPKLNGSDLSDGDFSLGVSTGRTWLFNLGYDLPAWHLDVGFNSRVVEGLKYRPAGSDQQTKDGYGVHDVYVNWQPLGKDKLRVTMSVKNLFDKFYYDQATYGFSPSAGTYLGYAEPGRTFRLDANWKF